MEPPAWLDWAADIGQIIDLVWLIIPSTIAVVALLKVRRLERKDRDK